MMRWLICLSILTTASCTTAGDFCAAYDPVYMPAETARAWAEDAPDAAKTSAANNSYYETHCKR